MNTCSASGPPPWVNSHFPRAPLRLTRGGPLRGARGPLLLTTGTACAAVDAKNRLI
jgi:hypothetical protein